MRSSRLAASVIFTLGGANDKVRGGDEGGGDGGGGGDDGGGEGGCSTGGSTPASVSTWLISSISPWGVSGSRLSLQKRISALRRRTSALLLAICWSCDKLRDLRRWARLSLVMARPMSSGFSASGIRLPRPWALAGRGVNPTISPLPSFDPVLRILLEVVARLRSGSKCTESRAFSMASISFAPSEFDLKALVYSVMGREAIRLVSTSFGNPWLRSRVS